MIAVAFVACAILASFAVLIGFCVGVQVGLAKAADEEIDRSCPCEACREERRRAQ